MTKPPNPIKSSHPLIVVLVAMSIVVLAVIAGAAYAVHTIAHDRDAAQAEARRSERADRESQAELAQARRQLAVNQAESDCRTRLSNLVNDRQADLIADLGDLARGQATHELALQVRSIRLVIDDTTTFRAAVDLRGDSVTQCRLPAFRARAARLTKGS